MDKIKITNLEVFCYHGVLKEENVLGQKFLITTSLYTDIHNAAVNDDINASINYAQVCQFIKSKMEETTFRLIESVAEYLSLAILREFKAVWRIRLEVKKPWAPILLPIETVSVEIERFWHTVYLSIGSNMGDKQDNLHQSISYLEANADCIVTKVSNFIETTPVGGVEQDDFLNAALELKTLLTPEELLLLIHSIESELKRERDVHWGPRTIDLDIIFYDDAVISREDLIIPHKEMQFRQFVLEPLAQIAPSIVHPLIGKNVHTLLRELASEEE